VLDGGGDRRRGKSSFGGEFGASHCNQLGLCDTLFSNYFEDLSLHAAVISPVICHRSVVTLVYRQQRIVISRSVCGSVCLFASNLGNHVARLGRSFSARCLRLWLGPFLAALQYTP